MLITRLPCVLGHWPNVVGEVGEAGANVVVCTRVIAVGSMRMER